MLPDGGKWEREIMHKKVERNGEEIIRLIKSGGSGHRRKFFNWGLCCEGKSEC
jgi:hypothetical protein